MLLLDGTNTNKMEALPHALCDVDKSETKATMTMPRRLPRNVHRNKFDDRNLVKYI